MCRTSARHLDLASKPVPREPDVEQHDLGDHARKAERADQAEEAGFVCFRKPFNVAELVAAVSRLLADNDNAGGI